MHCSYLIAALSKNEKHVTHLWNEGNILQLRSYFYFSLLGRHIWFTSAPSPRILLCQSHFSSRRSDSLVCVWTSDVFYTYQESSVIHIRASLRPEPVLRCGLRCVIIMIAPPLHPACTSVKRENAWGNAMHMTFSTLPWESTFTLKKDLLSSSAFLEQSLRPMRNNDELKGSQIPLSVVIKHAGLL